MIRELGPEELRLSYSSCSFSCVTPGTAIIGQEKAMGLLSLGLRTDRIGYNIFLSGDDGSGRLTAVTEEIGKIDKDTSTLRDVAYAYSSDRSCPTVLLFPKGMAREFQSDLIDLGRGNLSRGAIEERWHDERLRTFIDTLPGYAEDKDSYSLNIVIDSGSMERRPTIIEAQPSHKSLFGFAEKDRASHLSVRIGSYQAAAGGFLILTAEEITEDEELWKTLKRYIEMTHRALTSSDVQGEMIESIRPQPIPLMTKIILIGNENTYDKLMEKDGKFMRYFRIAPEFDSTMDADRKNIEGTVGYLKAVGRDFLPIEDSAFSEILRHSSWIAEDRSKLSTELSLLGDLLEEANDEAVSRGKEGIDGDDVRAALSRRDWYASLSEEKINSEIKSGEMVIALEGMRIGIVNGLAVMDRGPSSFGTPAVISVAVAPGSEGIVNIEHEAGLSGGIHDKGLLILEGYLRHRYAKTFPLSLYAGICFEQSYAEVDGDSASLAELYALLSAIGDIPIRQDIAVTGSVSQMGALQPVGGINEKIEGFFKACSAVGLTGTQGVIIPEQNVSSLILDEDVEKAVAEKRFHIYAISELDEGMELLSGMRRGMRDRRSAFPPGSFNRRVEDGLRNLCRYSQEKG